MAKNKVILVSFVRAGKIVDCEQSQSLNPGTVGYLIVSEKLSKQKFARSGGVGIGCFLLLGIGLVIRQETNGRCQNCQNKIFWELSRRKKVIEVIFMEERIWLVVGMSTEEMDEWPSDTGRRAIARFPFSELRT